LSAALVGSSLTNLKELHNKNFHNTAASLMEKTMERMVFLLRDTVAKVCIKFRKRITTMVEVGIKCLNKLILPLKFTCKFVNKMFTNNFFLLFF
jgi:hypothetical protein